VVLDDAATETATSAGDDLSSSVSDAGGNTNAPSVSASATSHHAPKVHTHCRDRLRLLPGCPLTARTQSQARYSAPTPSRFSADSPRAGPSKAVRTSFYVASTQVRP